MAEVSLNILCKDKKGEEFKQILSYINPNCSADKLRSFAENLNSLTTNKITDIFKVVEKFLSESSADEEISIQELQEILNETYAPTSDDNFTNADFAPIFEGNYNPVDDEFSDADFIF